MENVSKKLEEDHCLPPKPSDPSQPSLSKPNPPVIPLSIFSIHILTKKTKGKKVVVFIHMHNSKVSDYITFHS